jgi:hypothetical protein
MASPKPTLTILLTQTINGIMASGVHEDADLFRNVWYGSDFYGILRLLEAKYGHDYRVILNIPHNVKRST